MALAATLTHQGAAGNLVGALRVMAPPDEQCTLAGQPQIQVWDAQDNLVIQSAPPASGNGMTVTLSAGVGAEVGFQWRNWCGAQPPAPFTAVLILPNGQGETRSVPRGGGAEGTPLGAAPNCSDPSQPSALRATGPFKAAPGQVFVMPDNSTRFIGERFLAYWRTHGGLALNGYPISDEFDQQLADGQTYRVQYFERVRMEDHPENQAPYDVLLGQFGRQFHPADPAVSPIPGQTYFQATGHHVAPDFFQYWQANGGLAQFGYPISEEIQEQLEDGQTYTVQYFERARFERHPENQPPWNIELGQFGRRALAEAGH
ncbi:MAG: DUF4232 domain-containing protein [Thermomicrobiales bacterium]